MQDVSSLLLLAANSFGPDGRLIAVSQAGFEASGINSSASLRILLAVSVQQPELRVLADIIKRRVQSVGDGGWRMTLLACELIRGAQALGLQGPAAGRVFAQLCDHCESLVRSVPWKFSVDFEDVSVLLAVVRTCLCKPLLRLVALDESGLHHLALKVVQAHVMADDGANVRPIIKMLPLLHCELEQTDVFCGLVTDIIPHSLSRSELLDEAVVAVFDVALDVILADAMADVHVQTTVTASQQIPLEALIRLGHMLCAAHVQVVVCQRGVALALVQFLVQHNILVVERLSNRYTDELCALSGARAIGTWQPPTVSGMLGLIGSIRTRNYQDRLCCEWSAAASHDRARSVSTLLLCSPTEYCMDELQTGVNAALSALWLLSSVPDVVPGAGFVELALAASIERCVREFEPAAQPLVRVFVNALQSVAGYLQHETEPSRSVVVQLVQQQNNDFLDHGARMTECFGWDPLCGQTQRLMTRNQDTTEWRVEQNAVLDVAAVTLDGIRAAAEAAGLLLCISSSIQDTR
eukprot:TRINITY_DN11095_c0_g1_i1.p1 TRINITY_DN11095_c0_g1~~TRINITY_DN11095_c0_g1_i1.p1  ORF type:complete len:523 (+),score=102.69 TRINITY_DN11095_c0_g1_i1:127-1695(+)